MRAALGVLSIVFVMGIVSYAGAVALYDEQAGLTFASNFKSLAYNVTAIAQSDNGIGPAYLLNGLSDKGYWYQVGLAYNWPGSGGTHFEGFSMGYDVWAPNKTLVDKSAGGIMQFNGRVEPGDPVLLNMYLNGSNVTMLAKDWNTGAYASLQFSSYGATQFVGNRTSASNKNGFFTGLMTEWYHETKYNSDIARVTYSPYGEPVKTGWLWLDEFYCSDGSACNSKTDVVSNYTGYAVTPSPYYSVNYYGISEGFYSNGVFFTGSGVQQISISNFTGVSVETDAGLTRTVQFNVSTLGGTPPYTYSTYIDGVLYAKADHQAYHYSGSINTAGLGTGNHSYYVTVVDSSGNEASTVTRGLVINPNPSIALNVSGATDLGMDPLLGQNITGGTPPYNVTMLVNGNPVLPSNVSSALKAGLNTVQARLTDGVGISVTSQRYSVTVNQTPSFSFGSTGSSADLGLAVNVSAEGNGGTPPYNFSWSVEGAPRGHGSTLLFDPSSTGRYNISFTAVDAAGYSSTRSMSMTVNPAPTLKGSSISSGDTLLYDGGTLSFSGTVVDGTPPYYYKWYIGGNLSAQGFDQTSAQIDNTGIHEVSLVITDAAGYHLYTTQVVTTTYNFVTIGVITAIAVAAILVAGELHKRHTNGKGRPGKSRNLPVPVVKYVPKRARQGKAQ